LQKLKIEKRTENETLWAESAQKVTKNTFTTEMKHSVKSTKNDKKRPNFTKNAYNNPSLFLIYNIKLGASGASQGAGFCSQTVNQMRQMATNHSKQNIYNNSAPQATILNKRGQKV
jgi:hypothetical protein